MTTPAPAPWWRSCTPVWPALRIPVLAVAGERDMPDFKLGAEQIGQHVPGGRSELLPGAEHLAPLEAPDAFRDVLLGFLSRLRER